MAFYSSNQTFKKLNNEDRKSFADGPIDIDVNNIQSNNKRCLLSIDIEFTTGANTANFLQRFYVELLKSNGTSLAKSRALYGQWKKSTGSSGGSTNNNRSTFNVSFNNLTKEDIGNNITIRFSYDKNNLGGTAYDPGEVYLQWSNSYPIKIIFNFSDYYKISYVNLPQNDMIWSEWPLIDQIGKYNETLNIRTEKPTGKSTVLDRNSGGTTIYLYSCTDKRQNFEFYVKTGVSNVPQFSYWVDKDNNKYGENYTKKVTMKGDLILTPVASSTTSSNIGFTLPYLSPYTDSKNNTYMLQGWYTAASGGTLVGGPGDYYNKTTTSLYAHWASPCTITYDANGGELLWESSKQVAQGSVIKLPEAYREGYQFLGWNTVNTSSTGFMKYTVPNSTSKTLYAIWEKNFFTVTYNKGGNAWNNWPDNQTKERDKTLTLSSFTPVCGNNPTTTKNVTLNYNGNGQSNTTKTVKVWNGNWNTFGCWMEDGGSLTFSPGGSYTRNADIRLNVVGSWNENNEEGFILPSPKRTGYTLKGWYSNSSGGTEVGKAGETFTSTSYSTIYAQWTPNSYTITYNANGGSGAPESHTKTHGVDTNLSSEDPSRSTTNSTTSYSVTFKMNDGTTNNYATKTVYKQNEYSFSGWNTNANGTGYNYAPGQKYTSDADLNLFAIWNSSILNATVANPGSPERSGYSFVGWNTDKNATTGLDDFPRTITTNTTFYAIWELEKETYKIQFNRNGGTGSIPPTITKSLASRDEVMNVDIGSAVPTLINHHFRGWSSSSKYSDLRIAYWTDKGGATDYKGDAAVITSSNWSYADYCKYTGWTDTTSKTLTLYAQWEKLRYTITYNANGGSNAPGSQQKIHGEGLTLSTQKPGKAEGTATYTVYYNANGGSCSKTSDTATKTIKYYFSSWNTNSDGSGDSYASGANYTKDENANLYAQWSSSTSTTSITLPDAAKTNYTLKGWATSPTSTDIYTEKYTPPEDNVTLYAIWARNVYITSEPEDVIVTVGSKASVSVEAEGDNLTYAWYYKNYGESTWTLSDTMTSNIYSIDSMTGTSKIGRQVRCVITDKYKNTATSKTVTLNAGYYIYYQPNSGSGEMNKSFHNCREEKNLTKNTFTRDGYNFLGWSTNPNATSPNYTDEASVIGLTYTSAAITLYAVWEVANFITTVTRYISDSTSDAKECEVYYYDGNGWVPIEEIWYYTSPTQKIQVGTQIPYVEP